MNPADRVSELVTSLYALVAELESMFPGRPFTPDGHLVGSLGEVMACRDYPLELLPCSSPCHDARSSDGRMVQVKATQGRSIGLRAEPDHLLVLALRRDGTTAEIYNGPGNAPWNAAGRMQRNGQRSIAVSRLRRLMNDVPESARLPLRTERERSVLLVPPHADRRTTLHASHDRARVDQSGTRRSSSGAA